MRTNHVEPGARRDVGDGKAMTRRGGCPLFAAAKLIRQSGCLIASSISKYIETEMAHSLAALKQFETIRTAADPDRH